VLKRISSFLGVEFWLVMMVLVKAKTSNRAKNKRQEMMAIAGIIPVAKWLAKIKQRSDVSCRLCKRAREQHGASTENLPEETYGHISSAFCNGMATTVTAAHHFIWRHVYASMQAAQTPMRKLRFVTPDKECSFSTL